MAMYKIYIKNLDKYIEGKGGSLLSDVIKSNGLPLEMPCGGNGICGGCKVNIRPLGNQYGYKPVMSCFQILDKDIEIEHLKMPDENMQSSDENINDSNMCSARGSVAVDVGTTGVTVKFLDTECGEIMSAQSFLNPQVEYGNDLISRIDYIGESQERLEKVRDVLIDKIDLLIEDFGRDFVDRIIFSANTTMLHIVAGENPHGIAVYPFKPVFLRTKTYDAGEFRKDWNFETILLPSASAYIGADIVSGVFSTGFYSRKDKSLFIDIGTNGEIVMNIEGEMKAVSASAGPAFEGMNIECGSRAILGAIEGFSIDEDGKLNINVIGNTEAESICGSGLIDIASEFLKAGIVEPSGRFSKDMDEKFASKMTDKKFYLTDKVYISQKDIRQVQLAKAAISAGIKILLNEFGYSINDLNEMIIAGSFGYHLNHESILRTGIIPKEYKGKMRAVGNSSIHGAERVCRDPGLVDRLEQISERIDVIELSLREDFQDIFVNEMKF